MNHTTSFRLAAASVFVFLCTLVFTVNSYAATADYFLRLEGINGEGTYEAKIDPATGDCLIKNVPPGTYKAILMGSQEYFASHGGSATGSTIEISSFSWGASNSSSLGSGSGAGAGKVSMSDISIMKSTDKASPKLYNSAAASPSSGGFTGKRCALSVRKAGGDQKDYLQIELTKVTISGSGEELPKESLARTGGTKTGYDVKMNVKI